MGFDQPTHWLILLIVVALLFGWKKLPDASRSLGRSLRIFKAETKGLIHDGRDDEPAAPAAAIAQPVVPVAPPVVASPAPVATPAPVAAPVQAAPVQAAPVQAAPVQAVPAQSPLANLPLNQQAPASQV